MPKPLMVSDKAYDAIKAAKKRAESFTDVILRLTSKKGNIDRLIDALDNKEFYDPELAKTVEQASKEFRKNFKTRDIEL